MRLFISAYRRSIRMFCIVVAVFACTAGGANAHTEYILDAHEQTLAKGPDPSFLLQPLFEPRYIFLMILAAILVCAGFFIAAKAPWSVRLLSAMKRRSDEYIGLIPWIARISLGIALLNAGVLRALISPALPEYPEYAFIEIILGFLFLIGFGIMPAAAATLVLFLIGLSHASYLIGNMDIAALAIALLILADGKPGIDDLLGLSFWKQSPFFYRFVPFILRLGVGGALVFLGVYEKMLNPHLMAAVVEKSHLTSVIPVSVPMWVLSTGSIEIFLGLLLICGIKTRITSAMIFFVLTLSFFYFEEGVAAHITLFGALSILFITGGGKWSVDTLLAR